MAKALEQITVLRTIDGFTIEIEDDAGGVIKLTAEEDQLAEITDEIERAMTDEPPGGDADDDEADED